MASPGQVVLRVLGRIDGERTVADGRYVVEYDPQLTEQGSPRWIVPDSRWTFVLITTLDIAEARGFADALAALEYWQQICPNFPTRSDGRPNRPLTAFSIVIENVKAETASNA